MKLEKVTNVKVEGVDLQDCPDFTDAYISSADYEGKKMDQEQLDELNENKDFVYSCVLEKLQ